MFCCHSRVGWKVQPRLHRRPIVFDSSITAIHEVSSKWLHTVLMKAVWFLWGRIIPNWPSWINRAGGVSILHGKANTPTYSYLSKKINFLFFLERYYLQAPRHYYISGDKNVSFDIWSHPAHLPVFLFPPLSSCHSSSSSLFPPFLFLYVCTSPSLLTPHLFGLLALS